MTTSPAHPLPDFLPFQQAVAGRYSIERELGRGGMGIVFLAREVALDRMVALKLLPPELAAQPGVKERFLREARTAARLSHPNIVPIHAVDEAAGFVFFAMAYVEGGTLGDRIRDRGPLTNSEAIRLLREVAWALGHAHLHGVIHRDVKPDNILLEEGSGRAMVTDFGIAVPAEALQAGAGADEVVGTAEYMSPEQARGAEVDARSDLYSLGCVAFHALAGRVPFTGSTPAAVLGRHLTQPPPPLLSVAPHVPAAVASAVDRCLRKEPDRRFSSAEILAEALGPQGEVDRELPVPLRVFIKHNREFETILAWCAFGLFFAVPVLVGAVVITVADPSASLPVELLSAMVVALLGLPVAQLLRETRQLLKSGFALDDATAALAQDVKLRDEEFRFQVGERETPTDRVLQLLKLIGYSGAAVTLPAAIISDAGMWLFSVFSWSFLTALTASVAQEIRARTRGDVIGERWLRLWRGWAGKGIFKIAGLGLKRVAPVGSAHRPTELALGLAADRLYEELPKDTRKSLKGLPDTVRALEEDAQAMRGQVAELDAVLAEVGDDDPSRPGAGERARVRSAVEATRDAAGEKLRQAVKALETIRLSLLMMHAGGATVESLTLDLRTARDISEEMENLLAGHREVERLLQERRKTGVITLGPWEGSDHPDG